MHLGPSAYVSRTPTPLSVLQIKILAVQSNPLNQFVPHCLSNNPIGTYPPDGDAIDKTYQYQGPDSVKKGARIPSHPEGKIQTIILRPTHITRDKRQLTFSFIELIE